MAEKVLKNKLEVCPFILLILILDVQIKVACEYALDGDGMDTQNWQMLVDLFKEYSLSRFFELIKTFQGTF